MRHGDEPGPRIFKTLMSRLASGAGRREALDAALEGVDLDELDEAYRLHCKGL
jgi:hypothetical protein